MWRLFNRWSRYYLMYISRLSRSSRTGIAFSPISPIDARPHRLHFRLGELWISRIKMNWHSLPHISAPTRSESRECQITPPPQTETAPGQCQIIAIEIFLQHLIPGGWGTLKIHHSQIRSISDASDARNSMSSSGSSVEKFRWFSSLRVFYDVK